MAHQQHNFENSQQSGPSNPSSHQNTAQKQKRESHHHHHHHHELAQSGKLKADYKSRGLDICHFCGEKYNVGARIPRIIVGCGHTFCTSCLSYFLRNGKIRCPICRKMLKGVDSVDRLPLNFNILYETVTQDPLLSVVNFEKCLSGDVDLSQDEEIFPYLCQEHDQRIKHFYCSEHPSIFCRECIKDLHNMEKCFVVDLYEIEKMRKLQLQNMEFNQKQIMARSSTQPSSGSGQQQQQLEYPESYVEHPPVPQFDDPFKHEILMKAQQQPRENNFQRRNNNNNKNQAPQQQLTEQQLQQQMMLEQQMLEKKAFAQYQAQEKQRRQQNQNQNESSSEAPLTNSEMNTAEKQKLRQELMMMGYDDEDDENSDEDIDVDNDDDDEQMDLDHEEYDLGQAQNMQQMTEAERFAHDKRMFAAQLKQELLYGKTAGAGAKGMQQPAGQLHAQMHGVDVDDEDYDDEDNNIEYGDEGVNEGDDSYEAEDQNDDSYLMSSGKKQDQYEEVKNAGAQKASSNSPQKN